ncbi:pleckstrin homology domain-containing family D member 1-like [Lingula anatina]|uniref:Pleckstrin homology domain-containing family D member 1-like n=1 Tax=Lingula anatina TaxID=7574 RepID=A0A1S3IRG2_LINAN|nr:pleckstrin homology domain-containing family D member 1-like [Lingula anatina]|eukprot:XP_013400797.1 pleckstrin homology domain-containing family D member 1-like [Lingula anatina]
MPTSEGTFDVFAKAQLHGILHKRPVGHQSNKWSKRFFIVKDGFLLYYSEVEMKDLKKRKRFSIHPKGALPLGGCTIEPAKEPGHIHSIHIKNDEDFDGVVVIAAETEMEQEKWLNVLRQSSRITWRNAQLGEAMIQQLENQGLQMAREKQDYYDQLQTEASALQDEKEQREELQRVKEELEKEKQELEEFTKGLREEYEKIKK